MEIFAKIRPIFERFANRLKKSVEVLMRSLDKVATKKTISSLERAVNFIGISSIQVLLYGSKVFKYIQEGRPPGSKMPPGPGSDDTEGWENFKAWMEARAIPLSAEFPIRRKIAIDGINAVPILDMMLVEASKVTDEPAFQNAVLNSMANTLTELIKEGFKFPNIKI